MSRGNWNAIWTEAFVDELARVGVREICVAPGSRSTPLVLAAVQDGRFRMFSILDERSAGFFALGIGKASGRPAVVITTSGTAAANLYPAIIEASQGEVPLLALTADRPNRLRDTDGNQAMDQLRLFGTFPRAFFEVELPRLDEASLRHLRGLAGRAVSLAVGPPRGPVHLNFPFEKPLEPDLSLADPSTENPLDVFREENPLAGRGRPAGEPFVHISRRLPSIPEAEVARVRAAMESSQRGVIVAGPVPNSWEVGPAVLALAAATAFPVLADPLSGARFSPSHGAQVVAGYDLFLRSPAAREALEPELILRIGGSPTSSGVLDYLAESKDARQIVVDEGGRWKDHLASAHHYLQASPAPVLDRLAAEVWDPPDPEWVRLWAEAEARTRRVLETQIAGELLEGEILATVASGLPEGANLLVASSMPIRDLDAFGFPGPGCLRVFGNRGASGIDGLVSTTLGIAVASASGDGPGGSSPGVGPERPTVGVLGDLAFLHDMNGLLALRSVKPWVIFVVVNNDGGGIFHTLPVREHEPAFTKFFATPHGLDFKQAAEFHSLPYSRATSLAEFREAFSRALLTDGPSVLEVRTRREETHQRRRKVVAAVVEAMEDLAGG
ncbi:MAG: 2-succinyl-5-enolpyruvyl-6-hydroxy-3-cyclohexene-1-carboxylic-acid synthase [Gemmatimonadota bacterium]